MNTRPPASFCQNVRGGRRGTARAWDEREENRSWETEAEPVDIPEEDGIIDEKYISGALDSESPRANAHASRYYESVRHMSTDIDRIAENTGLDRSMIEQVKNHIFIEPHDLEENGFRRFYPSYDMAQSWQRLIDGKHIQPQDLVLLQHEYLESNLMKMGYTQQAAHDLANEQFNYWDTIQKNLHN